MEIVHDVPETSSDQWRHILDDLGTCWCRPWNKVVGGRLQITHRAVEG